MTTQFKYTLEFESQLQNLHRFGFQIGLCGPKVSENTTTKCGPS